MDASSNVDMTTSIIRAASIAYIRLCPWAASLDAAQWRAPGLRTAALLRKGTVETCESARSGMPSSFPDQVHRVVGPNRDTLALPLTQPAKIDVPGVLPASGHELVSAEKHDRLVGPKRDPVAVGRSSRPGDAVAPLRLASVARAADTFEPHGTGGNTAAYVVPPSGTRSVIVKPEPAS